MEKVNLIKHECKRERKKWKCDGLTTVLSRTTREQHETAAFIFIFCSPKRTKQPSPLNGYFSMIHQLESNMYVGEMLNKCVCRAQFFFRMSFLSLLLFFVSVSIWKEKREKKMNRSIFMRKVLVLKFNINAYKQINRIVRSTTPTKKMSLFSHSGASTTISILCFSTKFSIHLFMIFFVSSFFLFDLVSTNKCSMAKTIWWQKKSFFLISFFYEFPPSHSARNVLTSKFVVLEESFPREIAIPAPTDSIK